MPCPVEELLKYPLKIHHDVIFISRYGSGIKDETSQIFEPFHNKRLGKHRLGLATTYCIPRCTRADHGGTNNKLKGPHSTTFRSSIERLSNR
jgi:hypothetical protein